MGNVSKNMYKDSDDSGSDIASDDERLEGWKAPTASGVDNSKALSSYDDIASGHVRFYSRKGHCRPRPNVLTIRTPLPSAAVSNDSAACGAWC